MHKACATMPFLYKAMSKLKTSRALCERHQHALRGRQGDQDSNKTKQGFGGRQKN